MLNTLVIFLICLAGWANLFPDEAREILHQLKRQLRRRKVQRAVLDSAQELAQSLHDRASAYGIESELVDQFLAERRGAIMGRLEEMYAAHIMLDSEEDDCLD